MPTPLSRHLMTAVPFSPFGRDLQGAAIGHGLESVAREVPEDLSQKVFLAEKHQIVR